MKTICKRLAFSTLGCPDWDFDMIVTQANLLGFCSVELRGVQKELDVSRLPCFAPQNRRRTLAALLAKNLSICCIGTSAAFHDPTLFASSLSEGKFAIDLCNDMNIPFIRVFGDALTPGEPLVATVRRVTQGIEELCRHAANTGTVQVLLETHGDFNQQNTLTLLLQRLHTYSSFGLIWDILHTSRADGGDYHKIYPLIAPFIRHVHIKDCLSEMKTSSACLPGKGVLPIEGVIALLEKNNFSGLYSFEWEKRWFPHLSDPAYALPYYIEYMGALSECCS